MLHLTRLPPEILYNILIHVDPNDLAFVPRVCRRLYYVVFRNGPLYKQVYLKNLDSPSPDVWEHMNWERSLKEMVCLQVVCHLPSVSHKVKCCPPSPILKLHPAWIACRRSELTFTRTFYRKTSSLEYIGQCCRCSITQAGATGTGTRTSSSRPAMPNCWDLCSATR